MIFIYAFFAVIYTGLGAAANGCRMEEDPVVHIE